MVETYTGYMILSISAEKRGYHMEFLRHCFEIYFCWAFARSIIKFLNFVLKSAILALEDKYGW